MTKKTNNGGLGDLHPKEIKLLKRLRDEHPWGELTIEMRAGVPDRIVTVVNYKKM